MDNTFVRETGFSAYGFHIILATGIIVFGDMLKQTVDPLKEVSKFDADGSCLRVYVRFPGAAALHGGRREHASILRQVLFDPSTYDGVRGGHTDVGAYLPEDVLSSVVRKKMEQSCTMPLPRVRGVRVPHTDKS
ncbi:hypothetical protein EW145_g6606 [Phellinidium pouzarii]|uniref:Uncharacterized protein n=1 Tax=Phellinidium pouzarii TaxID=167371 RepID=A0A4S4KW38_9AGAM|nr:hypothetical protein EW145_g6606 [Phellinidium pouzarii]